MGCDIKLGPYITSNIHTFFGGPSILGSLQDNQIADKSIQYVSIDD
jgi:hypothetical protein